MTELGWEMLPRAFLLHECEEPGCRDLAHGRHCERHETVEDHELLHAVDLALLEAAEAEERWRETRLRVAAAERAAGIRRVPESTAARYAG
jgi:hypothetical protein